MANVAYETKLAVKGVPWRLVHGFALLTALVTLWLYSVPGDPHGAWLIAAGAAWVVLGAVWLVRAVTSVAVHRDFGALRQLVVEPVLALLVLVLLSVSAPLRLRVDFSRGAMDGLARKVTSAPAGASYPSQRVGLFRAREIERIPGGMRFIVRHEDILGSPVGFAFSPAGPPSSTESDEYDHLTGPWYVWKPQLVLGT